MDTPKSNAGRSIRIIASSILLLACAASVAAILLGIYPGMLQDILFIVVLTSIIWLPVGALLGVVYLIVMMRSPLKLTEWPLFRLGLAAAILVSTFGLLRYYVPRRLAFMASRTEFTAMLPKAPSQVYHIEPVDQYAGVYRVKDFAVTPDGGTHFRVYESGDGFWRNHTSYGFVYKPGRDHSPYGGEAYMIRPLGGGWYWFRASEESF